MKKAVSRFILFFLALIFGFANFMNIALSADVQNKNLEVKIGNQNIVSNNAVAIAKGFLKEEFDKIGASFKVLNFDSGRDINAAFASKSIDFGFLGMTPFVIGAVNNLDVALFYLDSITYKGEALVGKKGVFKSINDIKGQKIAVPFGTSAHYALLQSLRLNNIDAKDINILDIPAGNIPSAWERGDVKLAFIWELTLSGLKDKDYLFTDKDLAHKGVILSCGIAVQNKFAKAHPEILVAYKTALQRAFEYRKKDAKGAAEAISKFYGISLADAQTQLSEEIAKPLSMQDLSDPKFFGSTQDNGEFYKNLYSIAQFLKEQKQLRKLPDIESFKKFIVY